MPHPAPASSQPTVVVGVMPHQPEDVIRRAAEIAVLLNARLVCAHVDVTRYVVDEEPDGTVIAFPFDPETPDVIVERFDPALAQRIHRTLEPLGVPWSLRALAGDPGQALAHLADAVDATMIVVGTRHGKIRSSMHEFFGGSVAVHLAHHQHRPVLVIPLNPVPPGEAPPWEI